MSSVDQQLAKWAEEQRKVEAVSGEQFFRLFDFWRSALDPTEQAAADMLVYYKLDGYLGPVEEMCYEIAEANILAPDDIYDEILSGFINEGEDPYDPEFDEDSEALFVRQQQRLRQEATA